MRRIRMMMATAAALTACSSAETPEQTQARMDQESAAARTYIEAIDAKWGVWDAAGQADSIASLFVADARTAYNGAREARGPTDIRAMIAEGYATRPPGARTTNVTTETVTANGPIAIEVGHTVSTYTPAKNAPKGTKATVDTSRYVTVWHKTGDTWMVASDISSRGPAAPATTTRRP